MSGTWYNTDLTRAKSAAEVPKDPHFVILQDHAYTEHTGYEDEGYSGGRSNKLEYFWTLNEVAWKRALVTLYKEKPDRKDIVAFYRVQATRPKVEVSIDIGEDG
jgi:hypothetical protein